MIGIFNTSKILIYSDYLELQKMSMNYDSRIVDLHHKPFMPQYTSK